MLPWPGGECFPFAVIAVSLFADAPPSLAATESAGAAVDLQFVGAAHEELACVSLSVIGIVDRSRPSALGVGHHCEDTQTDDSAIALGGIGVLIVERRLACLRVDGVLDPDDGAAKGLAATRDANARIALLRQPRARWLGGARHGGANDQGGSQHEHA